MRTDFENIQSGQVVTLYHNRLNHIHIYPVKAVCDNGYFHCQGTDALDEPDYSMVDIKDYCEGYEND